MIYRKKKKIPQFIMQYGFYYIGRKLFVHYTLIIFSGGIEITSKMALDRENAIENLIEIFKLNTEQNYNNNTS